MTLAVTFCHQLGYTALHPPDGFHLRSPSTEADALQFQISNCGLEDYAKIF